MFKYIFLMIFFSTNLFAQLMSKPYSVEIGEYEGDVFGTFKDLLQRRGKLTYPDSEEIVESQKIRQEIFLNKTISDKLSIIKYHIINGNLDKAKAKLLQAQFVVDYSTIIQKRYMSIIHFIEGDYLNSLEILQDKEFYTFENNKHVCLLRVLNFLILNSNLEALEDWKLCRDTTINKTSSYHVWMNSLIELKAKKTKISEYKVIKNLNIENETGELLTLFLKLALYMNVPKKVLERLPYLGDEIYEDDKLRELIGMLYFRDKQLINAYRFIEDLNSPNSENLKGNLYLAQKKYELAYAQFKLGLSKKSDSQNAIERITPTAWILRQWKDGLKYIKKLKVSNEDYFKKVLIKSAFEIQLGKTSEAKKSLEKIIKFGQNFQAQEVTQMYSLVNFQLKDKELANNYSDMSCKNLDGINCWIQYQLLMWQDFTLTANRDDKIFEESKSLLKAYTSGHSDENIEEELLIDQRDIEELDNSLMSLIAE